MFVFLHRLLRFFVLFWLVNTGVAMVLAPRLKLDIWNKYHWLLRKEAEHYDVAFVGSSRVMNSIDPVIVDEVSGIHSINLGMGGAGAADQYLILWEFLKTNKVDCVLLQIDYVTLMDYFDYSFRDYIWLSYDDDPEVRRVLIDQCGTIRYFGWRLIPFLRMMEFSSQYRFFLTMDPPSKSGLDETGGSVRVDGTANGVVDHSYAKFSESKSAVKYLIRIVNLCRQNGIPVISFQSPYSAEIEERTDRATSDGALSKFVQSEQLPFWDFSRDLYHQDELFFDRHHLNSEGVTVFSEMLGLRVKSELNPGNDLRRLEL